VCKTFSVKVEVWKDVLPPNGQKLQTTRNIELQERRPDKLRIEVHSPRASQGFWYQNKTLTMLDRAMNLYGVMEVPGTIDKAFDAVEDQFGVETEENQRALGQFDFFFSRRLFMRLPDVDYFRDPFQNLDHQLTIGGGVGCDLIQTSRTEWNLALGPAWQRNWFDSEPEGDRSAVNSGALVVARTGIEPVSPSKSASILVAGGIRRCANW